VSSLALRSLLESAVRRAGLTRTPGRLAGLTPPALALHAAALSRERPVLLVVPTDADVETATANTRFFLAGLEGLAEFEAQRRVLPLPSPEVDPYRGLAPHLEVSSARARALFGLADRSARVVVASARALLSRVSAPDLLQSTGFVIAPGREIAPHDLGDALARAGFTREDPVDEHGEFCLRGGVLDLFPASESEPVRLEFIGDIVESVRRYDAATQRSRAALDQVAIFPQREVVDETADATIVDYAQRASVQLLTFEVDDVAARGRAIEEQWRKSAADLAARGHDVKPYDDIALPWEDLERWLRSGRLVSELAVEESGEPTSHIATLPTIEHHGRLGDWVEEIRKAGEHGDTVVFVAETPGRAERTIEVLGDYGVRARALALADDLREVGVVVATGQLSRGFHLPDAQIVFVAETDVFEEERRVHDRHRSVSRSFLSDFRDLKVGDLVVHVDNGIGKFVGLKQIAAAGLGDQEFMELHYAGDDKLFVPLERLDLVQKYTGGASPPLDKLGGTSWEKAKTRVKKAMRDMAEELLKLYAARKAVVGHAFSPDAHWHQEFADAFPYELTPDQRSAIADITRDLETSTPMDRLLCGDVGYGKTEVAMRAAFKVVMDGKQVAFLAPTTILAFQHLRTLTERFAGFPVRIDMISRFRTPTEQKAVVANLTSGQIDIVVGTHRLLSKDVAFKQLGLVVIDEEQRFGVRAKESIKSRKVGVDCLTLTATPIPRTMQLAFLGLKDLSLIQTAPPKRQSIKTYIIRESDETLSEAMEKELSRGGQVFIVHNRVSDIELVAEKFQKLAPKAKIIIAHGQMAERELEKRMAAFYNGDYQVLISTTIIESGLDIPNANTMIIFNAQNFGLSQLHQLRGRIGRSERKAYAYFVVPKDKIFSEVAEKRL
jgi:transcription-repair coupling factor (superfamily II helicase)